MSKQNSGVPPVLDFEMRGGTNPDPDLDTIERSIAEQTMNRFINIPAWTELGLKRGYNFLHTLTFYMSRNPEIVKLLYKTKPYPQYLEVEVTQKCDLRCVMCEHTYWDEADEELSYDNLVKIIDQFPNLKWVGINALGDPFTNKDFFKMLKYADDRNIIQELYTMAATIDKEQITQLLDLKGLVFLKFSLDAATRETYEKIRVGASFDKVIENIKEVDRQKKLRGRYFPELQFHFIIMKQNIHEAEQFLDMIAGLNIRATTVMYSRLLHNYPEVSENTYCDIPDDLVQRLVKKGQDLGIGVSVNADVGDNKPPANECMTWQMPYIFADGTVIQCCNMNEQNRRRWQRDNSMGNIFKTPFREIWNNDKYTKLRDNLWNCKPKDACETCKVCNIYNIDKLSNIRGV